MRSIKFYALLLLLCLRSEPLYAQQEPNAGWLASDIVLEDIFPNGGDVTIKLGRITLKDDSVSVTGEAYLGDSISKTADVQLSLVGSEKVIADFRNINIDSLQSLLPFISNIFPKQDEYRLLLEFTIQETKNVAGVFGVQSDTMQISGSFATDTDFNLTSLEIGVDVLSANIFSAFGKTLAGSEDFLFDGDFIGYGSLQAETQTIRLSLQADEVIAKADILPKPQSLKDISLELSYNFDERYVEIESLQASVRQAVLQGSAKVAKKDNLLQIETSLSMKSGGYFAKDLMDDWPLNIAVPARHWVGENIHKGEVYSADLSFNGSIKDDVFIIDNFATELHVQNGEFTYWDILPTVKIDHAHLQFSQDDLLIRTDVASTGGMQNIPAEILIFFGKDVEALATIDINQQFSSILSLANAPGVELLAGLIPQEATGEKFIGRLNLQFPMERTLQPQDIDFSLQGALYDFQSPTTPFGAELPLSADIIRIDGNNEMIAVGSDNLLINSLPAKVEWHVPLQSDADSLYRIWLAWDSLRQSGLLADWTVADTSYPVGEYATGEVLLELAAIGKEQFSINADFTSTDIDIQPLNLKKAADVRGVLKTDLAILHDGTWQMQDFTYQDEKNFISLNAEFIPTDPLPVRDFRLARFRTPTSDFSADISSRINEAEAISYHINIDAEKLDLIHLLGFTLDTASQEGEILEAELDEAASEDTPLPNIVATVSAIELSGDTEDSNIRNMNFATEHRSGKWIKLDVSAEIDGQLGYINYAANDTNNRINADIPNLGKFLRYSGLSERIKDGKLNISAASLKAGEPIIGSFLISDFYILRSPLLARLLQLTSPALVSSLSGEGIKFKKWRGQMSYKDNLIAFTNGHLYGSNIGMTMEGTVNRNQNQMQMQGTLVPFYWLTGANVIDDILNSDTDDALLGFSYKIDGKVQDPNINVQTLSFFTRTLKRLFGNGEETP